MQEFFTGQACPGQIIKCGAAAKRAIVPTITIFQRKDTDRRRVPCVFDNAAKIRKMILRQTSPPSTKEIGVQEEVLHEATLGGSVLIACAQSLLKVLRLTSAHTIKLKR